MSRLTEKGKTLSESSALDNLDAFDMLDFNEMIYDKLQKFENLMEEKEINNLAELCHRIETREQILKVNGELNQQCKKEQKENQALKDRWQKLKEFVQSDHDWNLETDNNDCALGQRWVLEKMNELEEEN